MLMCVRPSARACVCVRACCAVPTFPFDHAVDTADDAIRPIVEAFVAARATNLLKPSLPLEELQRHHNGNGYADSASAGESSAPTPAASSGSGGGGAGSSSRGRGRTGWLPIGAGVGDGREPYLDEGTQYDDFPPGLVDIWVLNVGTTPIQLYYRG